MIIQNQRPGVYSQYDVASAYTAPLSLKYAVVAAKATGGEICKLYSFDSYKSACEVFSPDGSGVFMRSIINILFESGVSTVLAVPVGNNYQDAFDTLETAENIGAVITDATAAADLESLKSRVLKNSGAGRECLAFCGISQTEIAKTAALNLNCERVVITSPEVSSTSSGARSAVLGAAALAGKILSSGDAAANYNGQTFPLLTLPGALPEASIQSLLEAGVTVFESVGGVTECIRALTTSTTTNGVADRGMSGVNTVLIIDDVMQSVRLRMKALLRGGRVNGSPIESIRSQVTVILAEKQNDGLIEGFVPPRCYRSESDPQVCVVEMSFKVAHVVSQIHVTAQIQV